MSLLKKLFSTDYRRAVALEGAGQYREAAERYLLAGEREGVSRMHRFLARGATDPWVRVDALRKALDFAPGEEEEGGGARVAMEGELARALVQLVEHSGVMDRRDRGLLQEAVELYQKLGMDEEAGEVLERLGFVARAAEAYQAAGNIGRMEEMYRRAETADVGQAEFDRAWDACEFARMVGDHLGEIEALTRCVEVRPADAGLLASLEEVRRRLPKAGRLTLGSGAGSWVLVGGDAVTLGREEDCGVMLLESGVSRRHARLSQRGGGVVLEDLGSTHGTHVGGVKVRQALPLGGEGEFRLGQSAVLRYGLAEGGLPMTLTVASGPLKGQLFVWAQELLTTGIPPAEPAWMPAGLALRFERGYWHLAPEASVGEVRVNGREVTSATLLRLGDEVSVDGASVRVG